MRKVLLSCVLFSFPVLTLGKANLNSICYMLDRGPQSQVQGDRVNELFEIASVSKVVTSYWALHELGPYFRFNTRIFITPIARDLYDVHIEGSQDPFWGRQLTHFLFSELNKANIFSVRRLSFDENLTYRWSVLTDNVESVNPTGQEIAASLERHIRALTSEYPQTQKEALMAGITLPKTLRFKTLSVEFVEGADFKASPDTVVLTLKSAPLYRYLKEMNTVSNNHVADKIFNFLGGEAKFKSFMQNALNLDDRDIQFINGSGNSITSVGGGSRKQYNKATCSSIIRILKHMRQGLRTQHQLSLKHVMAVSGVDGGTLSPRFDSIPNSMVAKTGTVDPAITLAGLLSTQEGDVYFGILMETQSPADWSSARDRVRSRVMDLLDQFGGRRSFSYAKAAFLPFDASSSLTSVENVLSVLP